MTGARYAAPTVARWPVLLGLVLGYVLLWWMVSLHRSDTGRDGPLSEARGRMQTFDLTGAAPVAAKRAGRLDGVEQAATVAPGRTEPSVRGDPSGAALTDSEGQALAAAVSDVLGDDPAAAGDMLDYRRRLLDHLRRFTRYPAGSVRQSGVVKIRFRIARDGTVIDSRIVTTQDGLPDQTMLDAAALDAVWRASPLPAVPLALGVPCEIDLPIAFGGPGRTLHRS